MNYYVHNLSPMALEWGWLILPWYWLAYIAGFFIVYFGMMGFVKSKLIKLSANEVHNYLSFGFLALLLGGRVGYILIYNLSYYVRNPMKVFAIWEGGMSFHGAIIAIAVYTYLCAKKSNRSMFEYADSICLWGPLGLFLGRMANFVNGELAGRVSDVPWAVIFPKFYDHSPRHPSQIYEAVSEGLILFVIMQVLGKKKIDQRGFCSGLFLSVYGVSRFIVEFFRNPDPQIGLYLNYFTLGQFLCLLMVILGIFLMKKSERSPSL
ncbi:prolipoprotein diacylglyceryl transferase [Halobacteriovorax marinus]|uniref:Phosphatidylglycerol--prolipoprotein diacylglyceryl transferase n=1 Tax=Halobacteriovorax marinus TaxID=97084 RepID=A0A1Y5FAV3_9BACT|nr:prolipoprotein diacylglyceryl transferase [Halobacteriovorax marinus]